MKCSLIPVCLRIFHLVVKRSRSYSSIRSAQRGLFTVLFQTGPEFLRHPLELKVAVFLAQQLSCCSRWISSPCQSPFQRPINVARQRDDHAGRLATKELCHRSLADWDQHEVRSREERHQGDRTHTQCWRVFLHHHLLGWDQFLDQVIGAKPPRCVPSGMPRRKE